MAPMFGNVLPDQMEAHMHTQPIQSPAGFLRLPDVLKLFPVSRSLWWAGVKAGKYPAPVRLSERTTAWRAADIAELIERISKTDQAAA